MFANSHCGYMGVLTVGHGGTSHRGNWDRNRIFHGYVYHIYNEYYIYMYII